MRCSTRGVDRHGYFQEEPLSKMNDSTPVTKVRGIDCDWSRVIHFAEWLLSEKSTTVHIKAMLPGRAGVEQENLNT